MTGEPAGLSGRTLGHFRLLERIGTGGMGVVYRAHDTRLERDVAVKVLRAGTLADPAARKRFRREALLISRLSHPYIAAVYDFDSQDDLDFLVMEHVPGATLAERIREGPLPAERALELDGDLPEAHAVLGVIHSQYDWEWVSAESEIRRAIQLNPGDATARFYHAQLLTETGRPREALGELERARALDPLSDDLAGWQAMTYYYAADYDEAIRRLEALARAQPSYATWRYSLGFCYEQKGRAQEAVAEYRAALERMEHPALRAILARGMASLGRRQEAESLLAAASRPAGGSDPPSYYIAGAWVALGDRGRALDWLERGYEHRDEELGWVKVDPRLAPLRGEPRFQDLLRRMRLVE